MKIRLGVAKCILRYRIIRTDLKKKTTIFVLKFGNRSAMNLNVAIDKIRCHATAGTCRRIEACGGLYIIAFVRDTLLGGRTCISRMDGSVEIERCAL